MCVFIDFIVRSLIGLFAGVKNDALSHKNRGFLHSVIHFMHRVTVKSHSVMSSHSALQNLTKRLMPIHNALHIAILHASDALCTVFIQHYVLV